MTTRGSAFLFDMDGTLVSSHAVVERVWTSVAHDHGLDPARVIAYAHGRQPKDTLAQFLPHVSPEHRRAIAARLVAEEVRHTEGVVEVPGAGALIASLIDMGAPVALVTSASLELATARMGAAGVPMPRVVVPAEDVDLGKPAPDGYLRAAQLLGAAPQECVVFEDAEAGILSGLASGAQVVVVGPHTSQTTAPLRRLRDLRSARVEHADGGLLLIED